MQVKLINTMLTKKKFKDFFQKNVAALQLKLNIMKQVILNIPDREYNFFMKVLEKFSFVEVSQVRKAKLNELEMQLSPAKRKVWNSIKEGLNEVELIEQGKLKGLSAKDFLNEL